MMYNRMAPFIVAVAAITWIWIPNSIIAGILFVIGIVFEVFGEDIIPIRKEISKNPENASKTLTPVQYYYYLQEASVQELETDTINPETKVRIEVLSQSK